MKVGILTFPNSVSHGATLQMYALYRTVRQMNAEAEVINYHNAHMRQERFGGIGSKQNRIKLQIRKAIHHKQYKAFKKFEKEMLNRYPEQLFTDVAAFQNIADRYDCVICGSDQVWNPDITNFDLSYFLDFCAPGVKKIAYAPSFGIHTFSEEFTSKVQPLICNFTGLGLRERNAQNYVRSLTDKPVELVLDPTLLMTKNDWLKLAKPIKEAHGKYILCYTVKTSDTVVDYALRMAEQEDCKVVVIGSNFIKKHFNKNDRIVYATDVGPREWLYLIENAYRVVTNSFHGTAFSINFHKDFYLELSSLTNDRLTNIMELFNLEHRIIGHGEQPLQIDYSAVECKLEEMRKTSKAYLAKAMGVEDQIV